MEGLGVYIYIYIPETCLSFVLGVEPSKRRAFPIKTRVMWVPGIYIYIAVFTTLLQPDLFAAKALCRPETITQHCLLPFERRHTSSVVSLSEDTWVISNVPTISQTIQPGRVGVEAEKLLKNMGWGFI